ncbi:Uncharacterised protein [Mycobacteroides abscessus subsp. abscessus]|nr:Uncharacterised protein [Mycobacteroides abscessus subsp. abscessus]
MIQCDRGPLHRRPSTLHLHRERRIDQEHHGGLCPRLGVGDLDVADGDVHTFAGHRRRRVRGVGTLGDGAQHRIRDGSRDIPWVGIAELPLARRPGRLAEQSRFAGLPVASTPRHLVGDVTKDGLPQLPHRLGAQAQSAVGRTVEESLLGQRLLELGECSGVDGCLVAELSCEGVEVDVVHARTGVLLRELLGERVEFGDVVQRRRTLPQSHLLITRERLTAVPIEAGPGLPQRRIHLRELIHQIG